MTIDMSAVIERLARNAFDAERARDAFFAEVDAHAVAFGFAE